MTIYFDASALTKLFLDEEGSDVARDLWSRDTPIVSSWAGLAETSAAIAAAHRDGRLSRRAAALALRGLEEEWEDVAALDVDEHISRNASELAVRHGLRGMDAVHLASACLVSAASPVMVSWDVDLRAAAHAEGIAVAPA